MPLLQEKANPHRFSPEAINAIYQVIEERRDMRHFLPKPVSSQLLIRLLEAAHHAPSVGYMQPWRIIRVTDDPTASGDGCSWRGTGKRVRN